jgi:hypothetical protein
MSVQQTRRYREAFQALRQFASHKRTPERCELCGAGLGDTHSHLLELAGRKLICACEPCAILFCARADTRYKRVPRRVRLLPDFRMSDAEWDIMLIPIGMAFFFKSSSASKTIALYPGPGGATESLLSLDTWNDIASRNPILEEMESDVEALLANRLGPSHGFSAPEYFVLPIDECYRLVGLIRSRWRGLSGGTEVWEKLQQFFAELRERSASMQETAYA